MNHTQKAKPATVAEVINAEGAADVVLVCEHASHHIPEELAHLGLDETIRKSHIAWDPGARAVAEGMAESLDAPLVISGISRLVYDCNRPPDAGDAMPARSEVYDVPGNAALGAEARQTRMETYYLPFRRLLERTLAAKPNAAVVTIHSFTPVYKGVPRSVEIGLLHDADARLADAMMAAATENTEHDVQRNAPYGPQDGVTHTLKQHALPDQRRNVMIEVRNDLIRNAEEQAAMARMLATWVSQALVTTEGLACSS